MTGNRCLIGLLAVSVVLAAPAAEKKHWGYEGQHGPARWAQIDPAYERCATGSNQSPVDLRATLDADLPAIAFDYRSRPLAIINNGHTVQVSVAGGSTITVDNRVFQLKQFHFHAPSEHQVDGRPFAMEAHFVHADERGNLAVVAVLFTEGDSNPPIKRVWDQIPSSVGEEKPLDAPIAVAELLPQQRSYFRYGGSLTTPPCTEGVRWFVLQTPITASAQQIESFRQLMNHPNNRPLQPHNARVILR